MYHSLLITCFYFIRKIIHLMIHLISSPSWFDPTLFQPLCVHPSFVPRFYYSPGLNTLWVPPLFFLLLSSLLFLIVWFLFVSSCWCHLLCVLFGSLLVGSLLVSPCGAPSVFSQHFLLCFYPLFLSLCVPLCWTLEFPPLFPLVGIPSGNPSVDPLVYTSVVIPWVSPLDSLFPLCTFVCLFDPFEFSVNSCNLCGYLG